MKAKVAITTLKKGDKIAEHAGHVVYFKIYEIDQEKGVTNSKVIKIDKEHTLHNLLHNPINPEEHEVLQCQILLTRGIGMGAIHKLARFGLQAYIIEENNTDEAIEKLINGTLKAVDPATVQHDDHDHHHHHEHGEGHDCGHHH